MTITLSKRKQFEARKAADNIGTNNYEKRKNSLIFYNAKDKPFAALIRNKNGTFFVSCCLRSTLLSNGKEVTRLFYSYGISSTDKKMLGIDDMGYVEETAKAEEIAKHFGW